MVIRILFCFWIFIPSFLFSQALVYFTDKPLLDSNRQTSSYLSERANERRVKQSIAYDVYDLPVYKGYLDSLRTLGVEVKQASRWLNAVEVDFKNVEVSVVEQLNFVESTIEYRSSTAFKKASTSKFAELAESSEVLAQVDQLAMSEFHDKSLEGDGVMIAIIDAGFYHYDQLAPFQQIRDNNGIVEVFDFVDGDSSVSEDHFHGMHVFGAIAASGDNYKGMAEQASFVLYRTENVNEETPLEEFYWTLAAERADSIGVDIINASLGYTTFDNSLFDYEKEDMDGETGIINKAANKASDKGILVVASAGNEGGNSWGTLIKPADSPKVLTVGAVNSKGAYASFSSIGPTADGRIKPDVVAQGASTALIATNGGVMYGDGTSYSAPLISGFAACVWQKFPDLTNYELKDLIIRSANRYSIPNNQYGYGLPNGFRIWQSETGLEEDLLHTKVVVVNGVYHFSEDIVAVHSLDGRIVRFEEGVRSYDFLNLKNGLYVILLSNNEKLKVVVE